MNRYLELRLQVGPPVSIRDAIQKALAIHANAPELDQAQVIWDLVKDVMGNKYSALTASRCQETRIKAVEVWNLMYPDHLLVPEKRRTRAQQLRALEESRKKRA